MTSRVCCTRLALFVLPLAITGCSYLIPTKRHLPVPRTPEVVQTLTAEQLVKQVNQRWDAMNTLTATVEIQATETKTKEGIATDFPSCRGYILLRKPKMLRVLGTYFGKRIFDMASDGSKFVLFMPTRNSAVKGPNSVHEKSTNQFENLRPDFFLDAIAIRGLDPDNEFMVASDTEEYPDVANKHLFNEPEYVLSVMRHKSGQEILPLRTITFHRDDMLPYDQYIYDDTGALETQVFYSNYQTFSAGRYPSKVTIKRPQEGIQLVLTVESVNQNVDLPDKQFDVQVPDGATVKQLN